MCLVTCEVDELRDSRGTIENHVHVVHKLVLADKNSLPHSSFSQSNCRQLLFFFLAFFFSESMLSLYCTTNCTRYIVSYPFHRTHQISTIRLSSTNPNFFLQAIRPLANVEENYFLFCFLTWNISYQKIKD